jgi:hypothetical protein|nr:MAG TPA: hypothetical protein [Caudoviricetes sp.]
MEMAKLVEKMELDKLSLQQLKSKLEDLENQEFMLEMIDTWTSEDYKYSDEIHEQIMAVKKEIIEHEDAVYGLGI